MLGLLPRVGALGSMHVTVTCIVTLFLHKRFVYRGWERVSPKGWLCVTLLCVCLCLLMYPTIVVPYRDHDWVDQAKS